MKYLKYYNSFFIKYDLIIIFNKFKTINLIINKSYMNKITIYINLIHF